MERLTFKFEGLNALRELGTFNKENVCIDCASCAACCEEFNFIRCDCSDCPIQKAFDKLAAYEDAEEVAKKKRMIDVDMWIDKLTNAMKQAPADQFDYCLHLINEIETEFLSQQVQAMQEGGTHD